MNTKKRLISTFVGLLYASSSFSLSYTQTGFVYPLDKQNYSSCGTWLGRDSAHGGCYISGFYHDGVDMMGNVGDDVRAITDGEIMFLSPNGWTGPNTCTDGNSNCKNIGLVVRHLRADGTAFYRPVAKHQNPAILKRYPQKQIYEP